VNQQGFKRRHRMDSDRRAKVVAVATFV